MAGHSYWSLERLEHLRAILMEMSTAQADSHLRVIEASQSIKWPVLDKFRKKYPDADNGLVGTGLSLFVKMGVLDEGKRGTKRPKRYFNPNVAITQETVDDGYMRMTKALPPRQY